MTARLYRRSRRANRIQHHPSDDTRGGQAVFTLQRAARAFGVQRGYVGMDGSRRTSPPETLLAVLRALGEPVSRPEDADGVLQRHRERRRAQVIEPTLVAWNGILNGPSLRLPRAAAGTSTRLELTRDIGGVRSHFCRDPVIVDDPQFADRVRIRPRERLQLEHGVWKLAVEAGGVRATSTVLAAPSRLTARDESLGAFLPLHAVRGEADRGCGTLTDLDRLLRWAGSAGCDFLGVLPLLPTFLEDPAEPSPYAAVTRLLPGALFVDPLAGPWDAPGPHLQAVLREIEPEAQQLRAGRYVDYARAWALQLRLLRAAAEDIRASQVLRDGLEQFRIENPLAASYAAFRARSRRLGRDFSRWPQSAARPGQTERDEAEALLCGQWLAARQLTQLETDGRQCGCRLYADWPIGIHRHSFDVWRYPELFAGSMSVGAPPDDFATDGQNWGFPPILPEQSRLDGHAYFRRTIAEHLRAANILRIDHVMGLHRLLWIPASASAVDGAYVRYPTDELYACIMIEAERRSATVIGENLGVVPAEVNATLRRRGFLSMRVAQFEMPPEAQPPLRRGEAAMINTHDTPTFAGFVRSADVDLARQLGRIDDDAADRQRRSRAEAVDRLRRSLGLDAAASPRELLQGLLRRLAASEASAVVVNLEDLWAEPEPQNTPGTTDDERPNWRRRAARSLEQIETSQRLSTFLRELARLRRRGPHA